MEDLNANIIAYVPNKGRNWIKIILVIIGVTVVIVAIVFLTPSILSLFSKDIAPIDDSDLLLKKIEIHDEQNAYFDLMKIADVYEPNEIQEMIDGKMWDDKIAEEILSRNAEGLKYFSEAASKPKFQDPEFADPAEITPNIIIKGLSRIRPISRASSIKAIYLSKQGKDKEAFNEALNSIKVGHKMQESQLSIIQYIFATAIKNFGLEVLNKVSVSSKLSSEELISYADNLSALYKNNTGLISAFKMEYHMISLMVDALASGDEALLNELGIYDSEELEISKKAINNYYFQPNKTKLLFAEAARTNIQSVSKLCGEVKESTIPILTSTSSINQLNEENIIGKIIHDTMALGLTNVILKKCDDSLLVSGTQVLLAIKAYKNDNGNYPDSLLKLVPQYLSSVPADPFDGKEIKYSFTKKIIYSVGSDMQDSWGSTGDDWRKMPDPTFTIDF